MPPPTQSLLQLCQIGAAVGACPHPTRAGRNRSTSQRCSKGKGAAAAWRLLPRIIMVVTYTVGWLAASMIFTNFSGTREAPPMRPPSMSG